MLFILPDALYTQYNNHEGNGQSKLLQRVKVIKTTYPRTIVRGDGQVVVVSFSNYQIEVCPCFSENDGSFTYPDSKNGGKWKKTDPMPEIREPCYDSRYGYALPLYMQYDASLEK